MSGFWPTRASPPSKSINIAESVGRTTLSADVSRSSAVSIPELIGLAHEDVELLDAVIKRAGTTATTFLTVFKAYNDILQERGLDPHEVIYYGKLLKLGTLKGKNWGEKWSMVKLQHGYCGSHGGSESRDHPKAQTGVRSTVPTRVNLRTKPSQRDDDSFTLHSHQDEVEIVPSDVVLDKAIDEPQYHLTPRISRRTPSLSQSAMTIDSPGHDIGNPSGYPLLSVPARLPSMPPIRRRKVSAWDSEASEATEDNAGVPSSTPPSYRAALRDPTVRRPYTIGSPFRPHSKIVERQLSSPGIPSSTVTRKSITRAKERRGSIVNEDDAWNKIKMLRDEKDADRFREDRLLERCWEVWKQGLQWIITTNEQIGQARDNLLIRLNLQHWRTLTASRRELFYRVATLANNRRLRSAFSTWTAGVKEKRQAEWRHGMRMKMKTIREKREGKLREDAWAKWRQSYRSHLSGQHYIERLVLQFYRRWKKRLSDVDHLEATADEFSGVMEGRATERFWNHWRRTMEMRNAERMVLERVSMRVMGEVMDAWKRNAQDNHSADAYYSFALMKRTLGSWKASRDRIRAMENRVYKHISRQDDVLLRAVSRVWKARERGRLLERVKALRLEKDAWATWKRNARDKKDLNDLALTFSLRSNSYTASFALQTWRQVRATHQNAQNFAVQFDATHLCFKMLLIWRIRLREKFKMIKQSRMAEKFFIARGSWGIWTHKLHERKRTKGLNELKMRRLWKFFHMWLQRTRRQWQRRMAEHKVRGRVTKRTLQAALTRWTNRVIEVKLRELEIAQRYETIILILAFHKWKAVCIRHVEEFSLMESYQYVKREENIRRMFHRWLSSARVTRHRRVTLQRKEDEMNLGTIAVAWEKWRDRFKDEKLRPIEYRVIVQSQKNLLFHAFGIWHSKTKSLPAIRFHASHTRSNYWQIWREAMPRALQAKVAREMDRKIVLSKFLDKWIQVHRTNLALKAVARARYLRLPTAVPRQAITASHSTPTPLPLATRSIFLRRAVHAESTDGGNGEAEPSQASPPSRPFRVKTSVRSLFAPKTRSETNSPPRSQFLVPGTREPSPTRPKSSFGASLLTRESPTRLFPRPLSSAEGDEPGRRSLWLELRQVRRKSRPPSEHSRSREPP